jgi:hypothetical protein
MLSRRSLLSSLPASLLSARNLKADLAIIGGGTGGCAAALSALRNGLRVVMTEETAWIGGQITSQLVSALDEHPWISSFGCTRAYRNFRDSVREHYRRYYPLTESARHRPNFSPGSISSISLSMEPRAALAVLESLLAPYASSGQLTLLSRHKPVSADVDKDRIRSVVVRGLDANLTKTIDATYFIDATELGDLLPLVKAEYVTGFESQRITGEPSAPPEAQPANEQSFTVCCAVDYRHGEDHVIEKPAEYAFWRDYVPQLKPVWPGKLLNWQMSNPQTLAPRDLGFDPTEAQGKPSALFNLWSYRRIAAKANFITGAYGSDVTVLNWPQNDYWLGRLVDVSDAEYQHHLQRGKQLSFSLLYWMQTEAPRPDGGAGWKGLRLRSDIAGTEDGMAMYPYIRESRRILAEFTVLEQHVATRARSTPAAEDFHDSVGIGSYRIDLHPSTGGDNYIDVSSLPFQIPLGSLIPRRLENLIAGAKNIGVTHITNGCYRLHPVEWNVGESAGVLAAHAIHGKQIPRRIRNDKGLLAALQNHLRAEGVETAWPRISPR